VVDPVKISSQSSVIRGHKKIGDAGPHLLRCEVWLTPYRNTTLPTTVTLPHLYVLGQTVRSSVYTHGDQPENASPSAASQVTRGL